MQAQKAMSKSRIGLEQKVKLWSIAFHIREVAGNEKQFRGLAGPPRWNAHPAPVGQASLDFFGTYKANPNPGG